jgi:hypothetical protein
MAAQQWRIFINPGPALDSPAEFLPDVPGAQTGDPLDAENLDTVFWTNQTEGPHRITIIGQSFTTLEIEKWTSSTPAFLIQGIAVGKALTYQCTLHSSEVGTIEVTA